MKVEANVMHCSLKLGFSFLFSDAINRQTKLKIKPHLKMQGSKRRSVLLSQEHAQEEEELAL